VTERICARFALYFGKGPDQLGPDRIRQYQAHGLRERKLAAGTVVAQTAGQRFFFARTLNAASPTCLPHASGLVGIADAFICTCYSYFPGSFPTAVRQRSNN
jgi:hypothetical protein